MPQHSGEGWHRGATPSVWSQDCAHHPPHAGRARGTCKLRAGWSSFLSTIVKHIHMSTHTEAGGNSRNREIEEAEDKEPTLRWVKWWKQPPPIQKPVPPLPQHSLYSFPFHPSVQRGRGMCEALAFFLEKQSSTFQKTGADGDSLLGLWTAWQRDEGSPERRCFFLSLSFSYLNSHVSKFSHP